MEAETRAGKRLCIIEIGAEFEDERWNGSGDGSLSEFLER